MYQQADFMQLQFLEGRWQGSGPDGKAFYEHYDFPDKTSMRSRRYADPSFGTATDSSSVTFQDGEIISRWGQFSWRANEIAEGKVCFAPVEAPSSFCWRRIDGARVEVTQRWTGADGKEQSVTMALQRIGAAATLK